MCFLPRRLVPLLTITALLAGAEVPADAYPGPRTAQAFREDEATLELVREEIRAERYWHAAELLDELAAVRELTPEGRLLLAEARAGYRDWDGVREIVDGAAWIDSLAPVRGPQLLGLAYEASEAWSEAARHYGTAVERSRIPDFVLTARLTRAELAAGSRAAALGRMEAARALFAGLTPWLAWELAEVAAGQGDPETVRTLLPWVEQGVPADRSRDLVARAVLASGDSVAAEALFRDLLAEGGGRAGWRYQVAALTLARGDTAAAWGLFRQLLDDAPRSPAGMESAAVLVDLGGLDRHGALDAARALDRLGDGGRALAAYDLYVVLSREAGGEPEVGPRVERARLASTVTARVEEAVEEFRALDEHPDPRVGARVLAVWADLRRRQGQAGNVRTLRRWLVERYPDTDQAAQVVFLRGDDAQDLGNWEAALAHYREVTAMAPERALAGLSWMRIGQVHLQRGDRGAALEAFQGYLERFPSGRRWAEASYWAGRILLERGDTAAAEPLLIRVMREDGLSYYAALSAQRLARPFPDEILPAPILEDAPWVAGALERLDLLEAAGLNVSAAAHVEAVVDRADGEGPAAQYPLGEGLIQRGWTIEGINRGWALLRAGEGHNQRLLRILYPFPRREMVEREAEEWGLDPLLMAGLIRQESAWDRDIVSRAGAIGLMQVMPPTGAQLARAVGPSGFTRQSLEAAEVNLHLGGRFLRDMLDRYGPELPLVLSAYNAGPTRARRWRSFPEIEDLQRFTERIPFTETRGYVKNVTRNLALYRSLYADGEERPLSN